MSNLYTDSGELNPRYVRRFEAQRQRCYLCAGRFKNLKFINRDHVTPKHLGGSKHLHNLLFTHKACNVNKGNRAPFACELLYLRFINEITPDNRYFNEDHG